MNITRDEARQLWEAGLDALSQFMPIRSLLQIPDDLNVELLYQSLVTDRPFIDILDEIYLKAIEESDLSNDNKEALRKLVK